MAQMRQLEGLIKRRAMPHARRPRAAALVAPGSFFPSFQRHSFPSAVSYHHIDSLPSPTAVNRVVAGSRP